jgi:hypothetical protein
MAAEIKTYSLWDRLFLIVSALLAAVMLTLAFYASRLPPHLMQEADVLNYHYTLARQHLMTGSFAPLRWSAADLLPLPLQFSLAPYWLATALPNKFPQPFFLLGLCGLLFKLAYRLGPSNRRALAGTFAAAALLGSHGFSIQYGAAMLDIPLCYLFIAALDSILSDRPILAGLEFSFFVWAKFPLLYLGVFGSLAALAWIISKAGWQLAWTTRSVSSKPEMFVWRRFLGTFVAGSFFLGAPFCLKTLYYAGTPFFPFGVGAIQTLGLPQGAPLEELKRASHRWLQTVHLDREEAGAEALVKHFWILAVPTRGVNNRFDYPMGLPYLLFLIPVFAAGISCWKDKRVSILWCLTGLLWASWWMTSHQARFLYVPIALLFVLGASLPELVDSKAVRAGLLLSMGLTLVSMWHAHRSDFRKTAWECLQPADQELVLKGRDPVFQDGQTHEWPIKEAAFATFKIHVSHGDLFVIPNS